MSKGLESLYILKEGLKPIFCDECKEVQTIEKSLKALEIIKRELKYNVDFVEASSFHAYIDGMICCKNKEEYDLLKEVLKDE